MADTTSTNYGWTIPEDGASNDTWGAKYNAIHVLVDAELHRRATWVTKTTTYTAVAGDRILGDTGAGAWTLTLPASPTEGQQVQVADHGGDWGANNLTIDGGAADIDGAGTLVASTDGGMFALVYEGSEWKQRGGAAPGGLSPAPRTTIGSGVSTVDIALPTGVGMLIIEGRNIVTSGSANMRLQTSTDGATFNSGASDYSSGGSNLLFIQFSGASGTKHSFDATIRGSNDAAAYWSIYGSTGSGTPPSTASSATGDMIKGIRRATEAVTHIRLSLSTGTFTSGEVFISQVQDGT